MTAQEYSTALSAYRKAISTKRSLEMTLRTNKAWLGCSFKKHPERAGKIAQAEKQLAELVIPTKPERVIEGYQIYDQDGDFGGFMRTQDIEEAHKRAQLHFEKYTLKPILTS